MVCLKGLGSVYTELFKRLHPLQDLKMLTILNKRDLTKCKQSRLHNFLLESTDILVKYYVKSCKDLFLK